MRLPTQLCQTAEEVIALPSGSSVAVPKTTPSFCRWPDHRKPMKETFGGKPVLSFGGRPMFAELVILNMFLDAGWHGRWVEAYLRIGSGPKMLLDWADKPPRDQVHMPLPEDRDWSVLSAISKDRGGYSGFWDVMAWSGDSLVFAEAKHAKKDRLQKTQPAWLESALNAGLKPEQFLIVEWSYDE